MIPIFFNDLSCQLVFTLVNYGAFSEVTVVTTIFAMCAKMPIIYLFQVFAVLTQSVIKCQLHKKLRPLENLISVQDGKIRN